MVNRVDIVTEPGRAWKDGVRMIPTLKADGQSLSGIYLSPEKIRAFVTKTETEQPG